MCILVKCRSTAKLVKEQQLGSGPLFLAAVACLSVVGATCLIHVLLSSACATFYEVLLGFCFSVDGQTEPSSVG